MSRVRPFLVALAAVAVSAGQLAAQTGTIRGRVLDADSREALPVVTVSVADRSVQTDAGGSFVFSAVPAGGYVLRASRVGYAAAFDTVTVVAGQTTAITIEMRALAIALEEFVVIGYGEQERRDLTGVIQAITPEDFNPGRVISPEELIQGKVAGVDVIDSGEPGGGISIRIRGGTSITSSNEPLFVVDGVPLAVGGGISAGRNPLNFLNPEDIESITILKDASATAIYGSRGANGVVVVETRGGRAATGGVGSRLTYTGTVSGSVVAAEPTMLTTQQFRTAVSQYKDPSFPDSLLGNLDTDWRDAVQRTGIGQEHSLAFAGATEDFDYRLSLGYLNQEGVVRGSATERATVGMGFGHSFFEDRLRVTANLKGSRMNDEFTPGGVISGATAFAPTQPILDPDSPNGGYFEWYDFSTALNNPVAELELTIDQGTTYRSVGDLEGEFDVPGITGLTGTVRLGYDATKAERETFRPSYLRGETESGFPGFVSRSNSTQANVLFDAFANYERTFAAMGGTNLDLTAGYSWEESTAEFPYFEAQGLSFDLLGTAGVPASQQQRESIWIDESRLVSFFGRAHLSFADRYLFTVSVRRDGSSKFGPEEQWGLFPSAAFAFRASDALKLRASWGKNGNQAFANYQQYPSYDIGEPTAQYQFGNEYVTTIRPGAADRGIKWEETTSYNLGIDYAFLNNRFTGSADYYYKNTDDLIFRVPVAAGTFTTNYITTNIGSVRNRGFELSLNALLVEGRGGDFSWRASFNAATNSNEIVTINPFTDSLETGEVILTGGISGGVGNFIQVLRAGEPVNAFYVYEHRRDENGNPIYADTNGDGTIDTDEALLMYVDQPTLWDSVNNRYVPDTIINQDDRVPYHSPAPSWIIGHTSQFRWGSFDAGFTVRAHLGNYVYNNVASNNGHYRAIAYVGAPNNLHASVLETGFESEQYYSDYYVEDASFLRMDNLTVGYTFPLRGGQQMRVFGAIQNVFMLTGYSGVDPLAGVNGIDNNLYPRSRTFTAGATVQF